MEILKVLLILTPTNESKCSGQISLLLDRFPEAVADLVKAAELRPDFALATVQVRDGPTKKTDVLLDFVQIIPPPNLDNL